MKSYFIAGTDTDVGKTYVTAGIARHLNLEGHDVGIMKPYAAGLQKNQPYKSKDVEILANAAKVNDSDELINPYFFTIPASPFTAAKQLQIIINNPYYILTPIFIYSRIQIPTNWRLCRKRHLSYRWNCNNRICG